MPSFSCSVDFMCKSYHDKKKMDVWLTNTMQAGLLITCIPLLFSSVQLPLAGTDVCLYSDGTIVTEDYFHTLADNTELVLVPRGQTWSGGGKNPQHPSKSSDQALNVLYNQITLLCAFKYQLGKTSCCYSARACTISS